MGDHSGQARAYTPFGDREMLTAGILLSCVALHGVLNLRITVVPNQRRPLPLYPCFSLRIAFLNLSTADILCISKGLFANVSVYEQDCVA